MIQVNPSNLPQPPLRPRDSPHPIVDCRFSVATFITIAPSTNGISNSSTPTLTLRVAKLGKLHGRRPILDSFGFNVERGEPNSLR